LATPSQKHKLWLQRLECWNECSSSLEIKYLSYYYYCVMSFIYVFLILQLWIVVWVGCMSFLTANVWNTTNICSLLRPS
jgi:hypothetical protein